MSRLRTPSRSGDVLIEPAPRAFADLLDTNRRRLAETGPSLCGVPLRDHRRSVRVALDLSPDQPLIVHGHQPELYHCGVWAKSVAARLLADRFDAAALQILVDYDKVKSHVLHVPARAPESEVVRAVSVPLPGSAPFYEGAASWTREDISALSRTIEGLNPELVRHSMLPAWLNALSAALPVDNWVDQLAPSLQAVDRLLEVQQPTRRAGRLDLGCLIADILANARRFATAYNSALADYRSTNGIRTHRHPVPDLEVTAERAELPLWITGSTQIRTRLYVAERHDRVVVLAGAEAISEFPVSALRDWHRCAADIDLLGSRHHLRPRALALSLWMRLCLADLFIHGIGGARYDQITDRIIHAYFGIASPAFACVSATLRLDLPRFEVLPAELNECRHQLRDLHWNPQRYASDHPDAHELIRLRAHWLEQAIRLASDTPSAHNQRRQAFQHIRDCNARLAPYCLDRLENCRTRLGTLQQQLRSNTAADSREYFYCLFPADLLLDLKQRISRVLRT